MRYRLIPVLPLMVLMLGFLAGKAAAVEIIRPAGVVELFTSQGCSSCPAADKVLSDLVEKGEVLGLSRHVDYWDYLGWKDRFALPENTELQYGYARSLHERQVYTPQAVINGRRHVVGSRAGDIHSSIRELGKAGQGMTVPIDVGVETDSVAIKVDDLPDAMNATLYMVHFKRKQQIAIERGENAGRTMTYSNVVHDSQPLGMIKRGGLSVEFPLVELRKRGLGSCALVLQKTDKQGNPAAIVGAVVITGI